MEITSIKAQSEEFRIKKRAMTRGLRWMFSEPQH